MRKLAAKKNKRRGHWLDPANCRAFFFELASKMNFDPLVPSNWHQVNRKHMAELRVSLATLLCFTLIFNGI